MKKSIALITTLLMLVSSPARADLFGGDVAVLAQILANAVQQLAQLRQILQNGRDSVDLVRDINRGINDSLNLIRTIKPDIDPGIYKDWDGRKTHLTNSNAYTESLSIRETKMCNGTPTEVLRRRSLSIIPSTNTPK